MDLPALAKHNGSEKSSEVLFSAGGIIYDVSHAEAFKPDGAYGQNWAGRDATIALAIMSLDPLDVNRQDWGSLSSKANQITNPP